MFTCARQRGQQISAHVIDKGSPVSDCDVYHSDDPKSLAVLTEDSRLP